MEITNIHIENVRGIGSGTDTFSLDCHLYPNKINFLVGSMDSNKNNVLALHHKLENPRIRKLVKFAFEGDGGDTK